MLKKIRVEQLKLGMHLHAFCGAWMDHPFWRTRFLLSDPDDIAKILASGIKEVWINAAEGLDVPPEVVQEAVQTLLPLEFPDEPPAQPRLSFAEEARQAAKICAKGKEAVVSMFQEVRMGKAIEAEKAQGLVEEISGSIMRNPGALISLARLKNADSYTYMHSVAVCALMIVLARQLGLEEKAVRDAGMAGLLHDLGKALIPSEILNKPSKLTEEEFAVVMTHPLQGHQLLESASGVSDVTRDVCLHHHERMDGNGYPARIPGGRLSLYARMGAVCDVYDAVTSNRPYKSGWDPALSIMRMAEWKGHFDQAVFQAFVKSLGIYPVGSFVRLESGRLGVVIEQSEKSLLQPKVRVFFSVRAQAHIQPEIVDLSRGAGLRDKIAGREEAAKWGIRDVDRYWTAIA